jgi:hypothetical protein
MTYNFAEAYERVAATPMYTGPPMSVSNPLIWNRLINDVPDSVLWYLGHENGFWALNDQCTKDFDMEPLDTHVFGFVIGIYDFSGDEEWKGTARMPFFLGNYKIGSLPPKIADPLARAAYPKGYGRVFTLFPPNKEGTGVTLVLSDRMNPEVPAEKRVALLDTNIKLAKLLPDDLGEDFRTKDFYIYHLSIQKYADEMG